MAQHYRYRHQQRSGTDIHLDTEQQVNSYIRETVPVAEHVVASLPEHAVTARHTSTTEHTARQYQLLTAHPCIAAISGHREGRQRPTSGHASSQAGNGRPWDPRLGPLQVDPASPEGRKTEPARTRQCVARTARTAAAPTTGRQGNYAAPVVADGEI